MRFLALYGVASTPKDPRVRRAMRDFMKSGDRGEVHSANGLVLHHILNACVESGTGFELRFIPTERRYQVRLLAPIETSS